MEFPKEVMSKKDLENMGFVKGILMRAYHDPNQDFAFKLDPAKKSSSIYFYTPGLNKWLSNQISAQVKAMPRGR